MVFSNSFDQRVKLLVRGVLVALKADCQTDTQTRVKQFEKECSPKQTDATKHVRAIPCQGIQRGWVYGNDVGISTCK